MQQNPALHLHDPASHVLCSIQPWPTGVLGFCIFLCRPMRNRYWSWVKTRYPKKPFEKVTIYWQLSKNPARPSKHPNLQLVEVQPQHVQPKEQLVEQEVVVSRSQLDGARNTSWTSSDTLQCFAGLFIPVTPFFRNLQDLTKSSTLVEQECLIWLTYELSWTISSISLHDKIWSTTGSHRQAGSDLQCVVMIQKPCPVELAQGKDQVSRRRSCWTWGYVSWQLLASWLLDHLCVAVVSED